MLDSPAPSDNLALRSHRIEKEEDGTFTVSYKDKIGQSSIKAGVVMFGTGRKPNTHNIGLEVRLAGAGICRAHACRHALLPLCSSRNGPRSCIGSSGSSAD